MTEVKELKKQLNEMQEQLDEIQEKLEKMSDKKTFRERPMNMWEFLSRIEWYQVVVGMVLISTFIEYIVKA